MKKLIIVLILAICLTGCNSGMRAGASKASQTFVLPSSPSMTYDTDTYILLFNTATGDLVDGTAGTLGATWANAAIATAPHATYTEAWTATIPILDLSYEYAMVVWSGTNYSSADTFHGGPWLYDPATNRTFSDTNPLKSLRVRSHRE